MEGFILMQTFLPSPFFDISASILDYRRLGKQRVEAMQLINGLENPNKKGWQNHPASKMWENSVPSLKIYCNAMIREWIKRGYKNTMKFYEEDINAVSPWWLGNHDFHSSHRSALLFKNYDYYSQFGWDEKPEYNYVWPKR